MGKFDGRKGSKKKLAWTPEAEDAFSRLKERLLGQLGLFLVDPDKGFVLRTDASDYAVGAVLEQIRDDRSHVPVAFWSRILAEGQRRTWTAREKETYAIVCALKKVVGPHRIATGGGLYGPSVLAELAQGARRHPLGTGGKEGPMA